MVIKVLLAVGVALVIFMRSRAKNVNKPHALKYWGMLFYGDRGSGKTLDQAEQIIQIVKYWAWLWKKYPKIKHGIIVTNQVLSAEAHKEIADIFKKAKLPPQNIYFHFDDGDEMRFCPRVNCWRGEKKHMLHGAVIVLDDIATFLPAEGWQNTPQWMKKQWTQAQHLGLHFVFNCQEPFAYDINARRATDMAYRFDKVLGSSRPDETLKPIKVIWGFYVKRRIKAKWLWQFGDMEPEEIEMFKEAQNAQAQITGKRLFRGIWKMTPHLITRKKSMRYDTLQDVKEYEPRGYMAAKTYDCIDPEHNHDDKKAPNYTTFKEKEHVLV